MVLLGWGSVTLKMCGFWVMDLFLEFTDYSSRMELQHGKARKARVKALSSGCFSRYETYYQTSSSVKFHFHR